MQFEYHIIPCGNAFLAKLAGAPLLLLYYPGLFKLKI